MKEQDEPQQLLEELEELRKRVAILEASLADQRQQTELLRQSEAQWRSAVKNAPTFIAIVDRAGTIQFLNHAQPGLSVEDAIGKTTYDFLHPQYHAVVRAHLQRVFETGEPGSFESVGAGPNGCDAAYETYLGAVKVGEKVVAATMTAIDITSQKRVEDELREGQRRHSTLMSNLPGMAYRCKNDAQWTMEFVSDGCVLLTGYTPLALIGNHEVAYGDTIHPDDRETVWKEVQRAIAEGRHFQLEYRIRTASGEEKWVWEQGIGTHSDDGHVEAVEGLICDITDRKRAQEALRRAHDELERKVDERTAALFTASERLRQMSERLSLATGAARIGIWDLDVSRNRLEWDDTMFRLYGITPHDFAGAYEAWLAGVHADDRLGVDTEVQCALRGEQEFDTEFRAVWPDQSVHWIRAKGMVQHDASGRAVRMLGANWEITEWKQSEEALRRSEERFRVTFEESPMGMVIAVGDGIITRVNHALCRITGYTPDELAGQSMTELIHPDDRELSRPLAEKLMAGKLPSFTLEHRCLGKDGQMFWGRTTTAAVRVPGGGMVFALGIIEDITERQEAKEALEREHRTLKHLLQSSDHERQLIAYEIHDGLAQQLAGAIMQFQVYGQVKDTDPKDAANAFHAGVTMLQQGHFEARRLISGVRPPILDEAGIVAAVAHLVNEERQRRGGPLIEYLSKVEFERLTPILENAVYRIVQEALANACRHSKANKVHLELVQHGGQIRIEVRDWGVGFKPEDVGDSRFGLAGIRERARVLGGKASIETAPGKGTRIVVELPIVLRRPEDEAS